MRLRAVADVSKTVEELAELNAKLSLLKSHGTGRWEALGKRNKRLIKCREGRVLLFTADSW